LKGEPNCFRREVYQARPGGHRSRLCASVIKPWKADNVILIHMRHTSIDELEAKHFGNLVNSFGFTNIEGVYVTPLLYLSRGFVVRSKSFVRLLHEDTLLRWRENRTVFVTKFIIDQERHAYAEAMFAPQSHYS
jgi:hypothetical protein